MSLGFWRGLREASGNEYEPMPILGAAGNHAPVERLLALINTSSDSGCSIEMLGAPGHRRRDKVVWLLD